MPKKKNGISAVNTAAAMAISGLQNRRSGARFGPERERDELVAGLPRRASDGKKFNSNESETPSVYIQPGWDRVENRSGRGNLTSIECKESRQRVVSQFEI